MSLRALRLKLALERPLLFSSFDAPRAFVKGNHKLKCKNIFASKPTETATCFAAAFITAFNVLHDVIVGQQPISGFNDMGLEFDLWMHKT